MAVLLGVAGVSLVLAGASRPAATAAEHARSAAPRSLTAGRTSPAPAAVVGAVEPGRRVVRLALDAATLPPGLAAGELVDVVAAIGDTASGDARVVSVASGVLLSVGGSLAVEVDQAAAERLLWAEAFAKALRVLVRPPGDSSTPPPQVTAPVISEPAR